jgi:hypothetical protein
MAESRLTDNTTDATNKTVWGECCNEMSTYNTKFSDSTDRIEDNTNTEHENMVFQSIHTDTNHSSIHTDLNDGTDMSNWTIKTSDDKQNTNINMILSKDSKRQLSSPGDSGNPTKKPTFSINDDEQNALVVLKGKNCSITEKNPIKLKKFLMDMDNTLKPEQISYGRNVLKIKTRDEIQRQRFMNITKILGEEVICTDFTPYGYNNANIQRLHKIIIFGVHLDISNDEIQSETGATTVKRLEKNPTDSNSTRIPTTTVILAYEDSPPERVFIGLMSYKTKEYIQGPIRCFHCQRFGHIASSCRGKLTCPRCAKEHAYKDCPTHLEAGFINEIIQPIPLLCPNCKGSHSAGFRGCSAFVKAKDISEIKVKNQISYADALKIYTANLTKVRDTAHTNTITDKLHNTQASNDKHSASNTHLNDEHQKNMITISPKPFGVESQHTFSLHPYLHNKGSIQNFCTPPRMPKGGINNNAAMTEQKISNNAEKSTFSTTLKHPMILEQITNNNDILWNHDAGNTNIQDSCNDKSNKDNIEAIVHVVLTLVKLLTKSISIDDLICLITNSVETNFSKADGKEIEEEGANTSLNSTN